MRVLTTGVVTAAALTAFAIPAAAAQEQESGITLLIQQGGRDVGQESFSLRSPRPRGIAGTALVAAAHYPAKNPTFTLAATLERTPDLALAMFQMDIDSAGANTVVFAVGSGARLIVRTVNKGKGSETGRQLPGGPDIVLLDDGVFSLYAQVADLATPAGRPLNAVFPRTGRRVAFTARREEAGNGNRQVTLSGGITGTLLTDSQGRLIRLELPATKTVVTRRPTTP